ncbi:hypothetical protein QNH10_06160 [Sporosarcina thermotolerans]|nr:hypothetical protein [Sporosarcina thermotolerans]WHT49204.1 hypothetical protein QNH10_06160 [Sporosarcina thermotolerans]
MGSYQSEQQDTHPALFGQNQLKGGFGPVYAIPTYPAHYSHGQGVGGYQSQQQDTHPALFDQNQLKNGFGPVYAIPTFPWNHNHSQDTGNPNYHHGHVHGVGGGQQPIMTPCCWYNPCYMYPMHGHHFNC